MRLLPKLNWLILIAGIFMGWLRQIPEDVKLSRALQDLSSLSHAELLAASDPWGSKYRYSIVSASGESYDYFYSPGSDKFSGSGGSDADDVSIYTKGVNWIEDLYHVSYYRYVAFITMGVGLGLTMARGAEARQEKRARE